MNISNFFSSSVGKKIIMALSGLSIVMFLIIHLIGNLGIMNGQNAFNDYAEFLHSMPKIVWIARIGLISIFTTHIYLAINLSLSNRLANSQKYKKQVSVKSSPASKTMMFGGITILAFVIYHLLHFTIHVVDPEFTNLVDPKGRPDVYTMVISGFKDNYINLGIYLFSLFFLCLHLSHGIFSAAQTLGITQSVPTKIMQACSNIIPFIIFILYSSIPLGISLGMITYA